MGIQYYAFALFVSVLICLIALLCKVLFADYRRQHKLLDEKETKLLELYRTVESIMEEFSDQVKTTMDEIKEIEERIAKRSVPNVPPPPEIVKQEQTEKPQRGEIVDSSRIRAASEVLERAERIIKSDTLKTPANSAKGNNGTVFQSFFDDTVNESPEAAEESPKKLKRNESILTMASEGKTDAQIASELGITRNEVKLVIGLRGCSSVQ